ncbi:unnamed protein product [Gongylonema pulchrum]|uniref:Sugar transporter SWEET1 n=1 Tax=Gongylonema pulchrum TaxID=637853 RepID=A0A183DK57_9BILA|nr:unnamed protein product [Gongylonema pulchrum]
MPLCIANFLVSSEWCIYGLLKDDFYLILPNGIGSILASGQLALFLVIPRKAGLHSPLMKLIKYCVDGAVDAEADVGKPLLLAEALESEITAVALTSC